MIHRKVRDEFLVFGAPQIEDGEVQEVVASLKSGWLGTGPKVARFEEDFAAYKGIDATRAAAAPTPGSQRRKSIP